MYTAAKSTQVARVMNQMRIHIMGRSECRWIGAGRMKLSSGETVLYSGRDDDQHMQGVAIMMNQEATKNLKWYFDQKIISFFASDFESVFA